MSVARHNQVATLSEAIVNAPRGQGRIHNRRDNVIPLVEEPELRLAPRAELKKKRYDMLSTGGTAKAFNARVMQEMRYVLYLFHSFLLCDDPSRFCRRFKKSDVEALCRYLHLKLPKHRTKMGMAFMIHSFTKCIVPGSFEITL